MNSNYRLIEKTIGISLIISGILIISIIFWSLKTQISIVFKNSTFSFNDISILKISFKYHRAFFLGIIGMFSGISLLKNSFLGWILGLTFWSCNIINLCRIPLIHHDPDYTDSEFVLFIVVLMILLTMLILMLHKYFMTKYSPQKKSWIFIALIIVTYSFDIWINT